MAIHPKIHLCSIFHTLEDGTVGQNKSLEQAVEHEWKSPFNMLSKQHVGENNAEQGMEQKGKILFHGHTLVEQRKEVHSSTQYFLAPHPKMLKLGLYPKKGKGAPMAPQSNSIYQFKITLQGITPEIWRQIQVPASYTFYDLHVAIQDVMGWEDYHLHQFTFPHSGPGRGTVIGIPDEEGMDEFDTLPGWEERVSDYLSKDQSHVLYEYDFGDGWIHEVKLEKVLPAEEKATYPLCLGGKRACPPEDCGGLWGYENLLSVLTDPKHEDHEHLSLWVGGKFDPEKFDPKKVRFEDPKKRLKRAFVA